MSVQHNIARKFRNGEVPKSPKNSVLRKASVAVANTVNSASFSFVETFIDFAASSGISGFSLLTVSACFLEKFIWVILILIGVCMTTYDVTLTAFGFYSNTKTTISLIETGNFNTPIPTLCLPTDASISTNYTDKPDQFLQFASNTCNKLNASVTYKDRMYSLCSNHNYGFYGKMERNGPKYLCLRMNFTNSCSIEFTTTHDRFALNMPKTNYSQSLIIDFDGNDIFNLQRPNTIEVDGKYSTIKFQIKKSFKRMKDCQDTSGCTTDCLKQLSTAHCEDNAHKGYHFGTKLKFCYRNQSLGAEFYNCTLAKCGQLCDRKIFDFNIEQLATSVTSTQVTEFIAAKFTFEEVVESPAMEIHDVLVAIGGNFGGSWLGISALALCHIPIYLGRVLYNRWFHCGETDAVRELSSASQQPPNLNRTISGDTSVRSSIRVPKFRKFGAVTTSEALAQIMFESHAFQHSLSTGLKPVTENGAV